MTSRISSHSSTSRLPSSSCLPELLNKVVKFVAKLLGGVDMHWLETSGAVSALWLFQASQLWPAPLDETRGQQMVDDQQWPVVLQPQIL